MKRLLYLNNLKVCLTVLVIFHHAGQAYGDGGDWAYTPSNPAEVINDECSSRPTIIGLLIFGSIMGIGSYLIRLVSPQDHWIWPFGIYESLLCVFISFGLLWLFREYGNWNSKFWQWCAAQAYGAYIVHLLLMIALQYAVDGIWMGAFGKFMFIGVVTTIASFGLTWLLRMIPGVKKVL